MVTLEEARANKTRLFEHLKDHGIHYELYEHPVVLTVEEAEKYTAASDWVSSKNLLLKDKKGRLIVVSALASTPVDLKLLSQRLGLGKGGLRLAPDEYLHSVLQVPPGCVTPFSLFHSTARDGVSILFDKLLQKFSRIFFHPLCNDATIGISNANFKKFFESIQREISFVDLQEDPVIGKDNPPDLAHLLPSPLPSSSSPSLLLPLPLASPQNDASIPSLNQESKSKDLKSDKKSNTAKNVSESKSQTQSQPPFDDVQLFCENVLHAFLGNLEKEKVDEKQIAQKIMPELSHLVVMYKNAAYTSGFVAGKNCRT